MFALLGLVLFLGVAVAPSINADVKEQIVIDSINDEDNQYRQVIELFKQQCKDVKSEHEMIKISLQLINDLKDCKYLTKTSASLLKLMIIFPFGYLIIS
jgi:hypothetical protein